LTVAVAPSKVMNRLRSMGATLRMAFSALATWVSMLWQ
jgi:hypothetical protein